MAIPGVPGDAPEPELDEDDLRLAEKDLLCAVDDGLEARPAEAVHGQRGRLDGEARLEADVPGAVDRVGAGLHHIADDHVSDGSLVDGALLERPLRRGSGEIGRGHSLEGAGHGAERGSLGGHDDDGF